MPLLLWTWRGELATHMRFPTNHCDKAVGTCIRWCSGQTLATFLCEMNPPDHSDMSQRVASSVAPEVTAVGSA